VESDTLLFIPQYFNVPFSRWFTDKAGIAIEAWLRWNTKRPPRGMAFSSNTSYLQQLLPSQQPGSPQQEAAVAAEADRDNNITAANTNDRALIFINNLL
jgi:hypothetical protein